MDISKMSVFGPIILRLIDLICRIATDDNKCGMYRFVAKLPFSQKCPFSKNVHFGRWPNRTIDFFQFLNEIFSAEKCAFHSIRLFMICRFYLFIIFYFQAEYFRPITNIYNFAVLPEPAIFI
jgi:hypothetical protein